jgi:hypothetical protein
LFVIREKSKRVLKFPIKLWLVAWYKNNLDNNHFLTVYFKKLNIFPISMVAYFPQLNESEYGRIPFYIKLILRVNELSSFELFTVCFILTN